MRKLFIILAALLCGYQGMTQVSRLSVDIPKGVYTVKGDYYFDYHNYGTAIANYRKSVNQNPKDAYAMLRIADAYHKLGNDDLAGSWYDKAFRLNADIEETYILKYMSILNKYEKYDELRRWMTVYTDKVDKNHPSGGANESHKDSTWFLLTNLKSINSAKSDAGAALYNDKLIFSSDRFVNNDGKYTLHRSVVNVNGQYSTPIPLPETINSGTNEGDVAIAERQNRLFFSRTGPSKGDDKKALPEVFFCDLPAGQSDKVESNKLTIKNFDHGMEHPAVNSDGTVLYFTSNNPKHGHGFDLYRSELTGKKWSTPHPLHTGINTKGDELYPVLYNDSILYFASNRPGGLGGLDIYRVNTRHKNAHVEHLSAPVNSPADDFGLVFNNKGTEGYLTSDRPGGLGGNDLYKVYALPVKTKKPAAGENVSKPEVLSIYTSVGDEIKLAGKSKENLEFDFVPGIAYSLIMEQDNYKTGTINNGSKTDLPKRNTYTFHIQKSGEVVSQQGNRNAKVHDTHINPGDLITFQLIPSKVLDYESDDSRIRLNRAEEKISGKATIVFSYVAEGGPEIPGINDTTTIADLSDASKNNLDEDTAADTVSSAGTVLAKNTQPDNKILNPASGKSDIAKQNTTVSTPDAIKTVDAKDNNSPSTVLNDTGKSNLQKNDKAIADTVSSAGNVLAKNTQPDNKTLNPTTGKTEIAKQNTTVSTPDVIKTVGTKDNNSPSTVLNDIGKSNLQKSDKAIADTVSSSGTVLAKNIQSDNKTLNPITGKTEIANQSTTVSTPDVIKAVDPKDSNPTSTALNDAGKSNLQKNDKAIADTVSSTGTVLAKNIQPDNKALNPATGKAEIAKQNTTVSTPDAIKAVDAKDNNSPSIVLNDIGKSNLQKSDKAIADTVSSPETMLAKNTQPDNNVAGTDAGKMETAKPNTTVSIPGDVKSTNKKELTNTVAADSLTHTDGIVKKEIIPNGIQEKSSVTATKQSGAASMIKPSPLSDSLERNGVVKKNRLTKSSAQLSSSDVKVKPEEATEQKQPVSKNNVADANTVNKNASEVVQPDLKNADRIADSGQLNSSDNSKALIKNELISDSSPSPTTANSLAPDNRENNDFQYRVQIAASASKVRDVQLKRIYHGTKEIRFFKEDGYYKYYIEETPSYPDARRVLKESGVENAFIAAYKGDTKWKLNEAIAFQKKERMQLAGNENSIVNPQTVNDNVVERAQQDEQKNTSLAPGTKKTSKEVQDEAVVKYSAVSPQAIAMKENSPDNKPEKSQVDDSTAIRKQLFGSLEEAMVAGERNSPPSSSTDALVSQNKKQTEQNQSENKNRNDSPNTVAENTARTIQQKDNALTGDNYQPDGLSDRNNVPLKSVHLKDSSQYQPPATPEYTANDIKENNDFQYRVQIAASRAELKDAQLKKIYSGAREIRSFEEDGYYKYYIGEASRYYVASQILKESNADNAFISVYKGKTKWQLQEAIASQNKVPLIRSELAKTDSLVKIVTVNFDLDEFVLPPNERLHLQEDVIGQLKSNAAYYTIVNGYADIRGSEEYNFGLSQERAFFVEQLIVDGSIPSERVTTQYFGESQVLKYCPGNENCDESVHQANRRVEILLLMNRKQR